MKRGAEVNDFPRCPKCGGIINYGMKSCPSCERSGVIIRNTGKPGNILRTVKHRYLGELQYAISIVALITLIVSLFFPIIKIPVVGEITIFNARNVIVPISWGVSLGLLGYGIYKKDSNFVLFIGILGFIDSVVKQFYKAYILSEFVGSVKKEAGDGLLGDFAVGVSAFVAGNINFGAGFYISVVAFGLLLFAGFYEREKNFYIEHTTDSVFKPFIRIIVFAVIGSVIALGILSFYQRRERIAQEKLIEESRQESIIASLTKDPDMTWKCESALSKTDIVEFIRSEDLRSTDILNVEDVGDHTGKIKDLPEKERKRKVGCIYYLAGLKKGAPLAVKIIDPITKDMFAMYSEYGYSDSLPKKEN